MDICEAGTWRFGHNRYNPVRRGHVGLFGKIIKNSSDCMVLEKNSGKTLQKIDGGGKNGADV